MNASNAMLPNDNGGLSFACLISLPEDDAFVITGGEIYNMNGLFFFLQLLFIHFYDIFRNVYFNIMLLDIECFSSKAEQITNFMKVFKKVQINKFCKKKYFTQEMFS